MTSLTAALPQAGTKRARTQENEVRTQKQAAGARVSSKCNHTSL